MKVEGKPAYSVYTADDGIVIGHATYADAVKVYRDYCETMRLSFEEDADVEDMRDPSDYEVRLVQDVAVSMPEEVPAPEDELTVDRFGRRIPYYSWLQEEVHDEKA